MFKWLFQFSVEQLPALEQQLQQQEIKLKAAAPDPAQVKKLEATVDKAKKCKFNVFKT